MNFLKSKLSLRRDARHWLGKSLTISGHKISIIKLLSEGAFGFVFLVKSGGKHLALKRLVSSTYDPSLEEQIEREIRIMKQLSPHPNIVRFFEFCVQTLKSGEKEYLILMEFCPKNMIEYLNEKKTEGGLKENEVLNFFSEICEGVAHMHTQPTPITHRDLKLENILLGEDGTCKICDFGSAVLGTVSPDTKQKMAEIEEDISKNTTLPYRAPEMVDLFSKKYISEKVDIWALGCLLYKMAYLQSPFENSGALGIVNAHYDIPSNSQYSESFNSLIKFMLNPNPDERPTIEQVKREIKNSNHKQTKNLSQKSSTKGSSAQLPHLSRQNTAPELGISSSISTQTTFDPFGLEKEKNFTSQSPFNPFSSPTNLTIPKDGNNFHVAPKKTHRRINSEQPTVHFQIPTASPFQLRQPPQPTRGHRRSASANVPSNETSLL